jgi:lipoyl synthase
LIRLSAGTAACLGLTGSIMDAYPTTAYLLSGKSCLMNCAFCPQGFGSSAALKRLGRISWPEYAWADLEEKLARPEESGLRRLCLQSVRHENGIETLLREIGRLKKITDLPLSLSAWIRNPSEVKELFAADVERMSISLDVVNPEAFKKIKGGSQADRIKLLLNCAENFPGQMSTHLICGLGESEEETLALAGRLIEAGVTVALFAFVPLRGTKLENAAPPAIDSYRRTQVAVHLLRTKAVSRSNFDFRAGQLISFGLPQEELVKLLSDGAAFRTSGCPDCNRPYYNERPGGTIYNYHRPLNQQELTTAIETVKKGRGLCHTFSGEAR